MNRAQFQRFEKTIRACKLCRQHLPLGPRPVLQISPTTRALIAGRATGRRVHDTGIPFQDSSADRLREWLGLDAEAFYDASWVAKALA